MIRGPAGRHASAAAGLFHGESGSRCAAAPLAFDYAERGRARALLDAAVRAGSPVQDASVPGGRPRRADEIAAALPSAFTLVEYAVVGDRMVAWTMRRGERVKLWHLDGSPARFADDVVRMRVAAATSGVSASAAAGASERLYERLVAPLLSTIPSGGRIVFVPDGPLHDLPFPLLREARTGRYLIESHVLVVAPSSTLFLHSLARDRELARAGPGTALVIANPAFDRRLFPELPQLPGSEVEATALRSLRLPITVLAGLEATKSSFLKHAVSAELVHFGGHALINPANPMMSRLILAASPGDPAGGALYVHELWGRRLARTRLVVLAACDAARGRQLRSEGVISLARSFLAAGVPAVIASVAPVADPVAPAFFARFYASFAATGDPARALQEAQLPCLRSADRDLHSPATCGQFEIIGG